MKSVRLAGSAAAGLFSVMAAVAAVIAGIIALTAFSIFAGGCRFSEQAVDRTVVSSSEMRFDYLDPDRDISDITGTVIGGGTGGGGGC